MQTIQNRSELENECTISLLTPIHITFSRVIAQSYLIYNRIGIWKCWFLRRGENQSTRRKTFRGEGENQQQIQPTCGVHARIRTGATLVGGECSHHRAIPCSTKLLRITCTPHWIVPELAMYLKYLTTHAVEWPAAEFGGTNLFYSRDKTSPLDIVWRNQLRPLFRCTWRLSRLLPIQCPVKRRKNERYRHSFHSPKTNTQSASSLILNENISNEDDVKCGNTNLKEHMIVAVVIAI